MKKIGILLFAALGLWSCDIVGGAPVEEPTAADSIEIKAVSLSIPADGSAAAYAVFEASADVAAAPEHSWCTCEVREDTIFFSAPENPTLLSRNCKVEVSAGSAGCTLTVMQFGYKSSGFYPEDISVEADAQRIAVPYSYELRMRAFCAESWITLEVKSDSLIINVAEDVARATATDISRKAVISWTLGVDSGEITLTQLHPDFLQEDPNWTVSYEGTATYQGTEVDQIKNTVAESGVSGKYLVTYYLKSEVEESGLKLASFLATQFENMKEELDELIAYYLSKGTSLTYDDFLSEDTVTDLFNAFDDGTYYGLAIGFDSQMNPTGRYAYVEFTKGGSDEPTGYDAWLGEWSVPRGTTTDTWTISEKESGSTYTISGVEGLSAYPIVGEYDSSTEGFVVRVQTDLGTASSSNAGDLSILFTGLCGSSLFTSTSVVVFTATKDGDTATLTPSTVSTSSGDKTIDACAYFGKSSEGKYYYLSNERTSLPATMTKGGSSGSSIKSLGAGFQPVESECTPEDVPDSRIIRNK